ncbi:hypothetical protein [Nostoc sphaeroides]|uniref:Uncharacterized protein n=1 Tax=Nostoc sphaeroides CCNUC1 TaxID=2653204 RepID=A0A5P8W6H5_9NOSO|nr:hypothetical protein [Nostoc sphaeroides]MCC5626736.1 hypothetical protein [Nostoc sphaeroides CHAB 2801]QFS48357.1 hypothetical protein GXM_05849 [Nostoc sphaeroides CCNUC1]
MKRCQRWSLSAAEVRATPTLLIEHKQGCKFHRVILTKNDVQSISVL